MEISNRGSRLQLADVFVSIEYPRQAAKVEHDLVELLVVAVAAVLAGADTFVEIEIWAEEKLDWFRRYLPLVHGIASHDIFGRMFGLIEPGQFEAAFQRWMQGVLPALDAQVVAIDGKTGVPSDRSSSLGWKTSRRSGGVDATELHLVSAFAAGAGVVPGRGHRRKVQQDQGDPGVVGHSCVGWLRGNHRCRGHTNGHRRRHRRARRRLCAGGQGQSAPVGRIYSGLLALLPHPSCPAYAA